MTKYEHDILLKRIIKSKKIQKIINTAYYIEEDFEINIEEDILSAMISNDTTVLQAVVDFALGIGEIYDILTHEKEKGDINE